MRLFQGRGRRMAGAAVTCVLLLHGLGASAEVLTPEKLVGDITLEGLESNLWHLNQIAKDNGGNRAFGLPGFAASKDYLLEKIGRYEDVTSYAQSFREWFTQTVSISLTIPLLQPTPIEIVTFTGAVATPDRKPITAPLVLVPVDDVDGTGCLEKHYSSLDAAGKIVVVKRGLCTFGLKAKLAKRYGAVGVVIWNNVETPVTGGTLGPRDEYAPVGLVGLADGLRIVEVLEGEEEGAVQATLLVDAVGEMRETWNVIAETHEGDPDNVIVLGAHLDSVQDGPGINDDGSGSTALIELLFAVKKYGINNKVRFIWWGAEESGLLGSYHYTDDLYPEEVADIAAYLNFDMIASPKAFYGVFDGSGSAHGYHPPPGSSYLETLFTNFLTSAPYSLSTTPAAFSNGSDYVGFLDIGVPVGGLFTGTPPQDECYHLACDDLGNVNWEVLLTNTRAAADVLARLAMDLGGLPGRRERAERAGRVGAERRRRRGEEGGWESHVGHGHGNGHEREGGVRFASCEHHMHTLM